MCDLRRCMVERKIMLVLGCAHQGIAARNIGGITIMRASKQRPFQTTDAYSKNAKTTAELDQLVLRMEL